MAAAVIAADVDAAVAALPLLPDASGAATTPHPFFVYGTLMTGMRNHANFVRGRIAAPPARASLRGGAELFHFPSMGFPGMRRAASPAGGAVVWGELLAVPEADFPSVLRELDALED
jgi:gamma-glutamylcyclotransferase (GGCT)/AIG2-like uncharacterized protein YtfP